MNVLSSVPLASSVHVVASADTWLELEDRRTGFRVVLEDCDDANELRGFLADVGLLTGTGVEQARQKQHAFKQEQAWDERLERVTELLGRVAEHVPYYRDRRKSYHRAVRSQAELLELPLLRRQDLKRHALDLCSDQIDFKAELASGRLELASTSGTTDERVQAFADSTHTRIFSSYPELWGVPARAVAPRTAVLTSPFCMAERCTRTGSMQSRIVHEHTLFLPGPPQLFALSREDVLQIAEELGRFAPAIWLVNPVYAHWLVRRASELGIELPRPDVVVSTYQYPSKLQSRALRRQLGVPVFNLYAATELGGCQIGLECGHGRLHVREDHCLVELLGRDGRPVSSGLGAVVVTTLANEVAPLVRYTVGDLAMKVDDACDCTLSDWPTIELHGREREALYLDGRFITTREVDDLISGVEGIDFYGCRQVADSALEIDVVPSLSKPVEPRALVDALRSALPVASVRVDVVNGLDPAPSLKFPLTSGPSAKPTWLPA